MNDIIENKTYHQLIEENLIPNDIKEEDFILARESLKVIIDNSLLATILAVIFVAMFIVWLIWFINRF